MRASTVEPGDRCVVERLQSAAQHNGKIGLVQSIEGERRGVCLGAGGLQQLQLSVKPQNLKVLPTPTLGIVLVGDSASDPCRALLAHILEHRNSVVCDSGAAASYVAVLAIAGPSGAVHIDASQGSCRRPGALHGGLDDETMRAAMKDLSTCDGYKSSKGSGYRRLEATLKVCKQCHQPHPTPHSNSVPRAPSAARVPLIRRRHYHRSLCSISAPRRPPSHSYAAPPATSASRGTAASASRPTRPPTAQPFSFRGCVCCRPLPRLMVSSRRLRSSTRFVPRGVAASAPW